MISHCDSNENTEEVHPMENLNKLLSFISVIVQKEITASIYKKRKALKFYYNVWKQK